MTSHSNYDRLRESFELDVLSYLFCSFVAIHDGHIAVHKDEIIVTKLAVVEFHVSFYLIKCFKAIHSGYADLISIFQI